MRVFVDTNVWLAGRFGRGLCADLLETLVEESVDILIDERVREEFRRIGSEKFRVDDRTLDEADIFFRRYTRILPANDHPVSLVPDADDALILAAALYGSADVFVTGDKALIALESIESMQVLDPRSIYMRLRGL